MKLARQRSSNCQLALTTCFLACRLFLATFGQPEGGIMADDKNKVGKQDRDRINVDEDYELSDWEKHFGVSRERIREAVKAAGPMVKDVDKWLKGHHSSK